MIEYPSRAETLEFKEFLFRLSPAQQHVLRSAASAIRQNGPHIDGICKAYLPAFDREKAIRFITWLSAEP